MPILRLPAREVCLTDRYCTSPGGRRVYDFVIHAIRDVSVSCPICRGAAPEGVPDRVCDLVRIEYGGTHVVAHPTDRVLVDRNDDGSHPAPD